MLPLRKPLAQFFQEQPHPPIPTPPCSPTEPQNPPRPDSVPPITNEQQLPPIPNAQQQQQQQNNFDFSTLVLGFCLTGAMDIAIQFRTVNPLIFHLLCLMVVFAFASIFVAKSIAPKHLNAARKLGIVGAFFGVTAFFLAVTISFPLCLRIISWIIDALSLLAILICNRPRPLFPI